MQFLIVFLINLSTTDRFRRPLHSILMYGRKENYVKSIMRSQLTLQRRQLSRHQLLGCHELLSCMTAGPSHVWSSRLDVDDVLPLYTARVSVKILTLLVHGQFWTPDQGFVKEKNSDAAKASRGRVTSSRLCVLVQSRSCVHAVYTHPHSPATP